jgi:hypothetical protein
MHACNNAYGVAGYPDPASKPSTDQSTRMTRIAGASAKHMHAKYTTAMRSGSRADGAVVTAETIGNALNEYLNGTAYVYIMGCDITKVGDVCEAKLQLSRHSRHGYQREGTHIPLRRIDDRDPRLTADEVTSQFCGFTVSQWLDE